jgi:hypothetical protein
MEGTSSGDGVLRKLFVVRHTLGGSLQQLSSVSTAIRRSRQVQNVPQTVEWKSIRAIFVAYGAVADGEKVTATQEMRSVTAKPTLVHLHVLLQLEGGDAVVEMQTAEGAAAASKVLMRVNRAVYPIAQFSDLMHPRLCRLWESASLTATSG